MAHTGMCRWTGYGFDLSVLNRVYNFVRVCLIINRMKFVCTSSIQSKDYNVNLLHTLLSVRWTPSGLSCSATVFWVGESLFMFVLL